MADPALGNGVPENPEENYKSTGGTFRPFSPTAATLDPKTREVGGEIFNIKKSTQELEARLKEEEARTEGAKKVTVMLSDIKDLIHTAGEFTKTPIEQTTKAELFETQARTEEAFATAHEDPTSEALKELAAALDTFREAVEKAEKEAASLSLGKTEAEKKVELQQEILELSFEVETVLKEAHSLENEINDDAVKASFSNETTRTEMLFSSLKRNVEDALKKDFDEEYKKYKDNIELIKQFIQKNPKIAPPVVTPAPTTPPTAAPTPSPSPAPAAAPKTPDAPLNEFIGWPTDIVFYRGKQKTGGRVGWHIRNSDGSIDLLGNQAAWENENKAFDILFKKYEALLKSLSFAEKTHFRPLIEAKNAVIQAIWKGDIENVVSERGAFEIALEREQEVRENAEGGDTLAANLRGIDRHYEKEVDFLMRRFTAVKPFSTEEEIKKTENAFEELEVAKDDLKEYLEHYGLEKDNLQRKHTETAYRAALEELYTILRTKELEKKDELRQARKENVVKNGEVSKIEQTFKTKQLEARANVNRLIRPIPPSDTEKAAQEAIEKTEKARREQEVQDKYESMFQDDENGFIALYATAAFDKKTEKIIYTANERLRVHPMKTVIKQVLLSHNIDVGEKTLETRVEEHRKEQERDRLKITEDSTFYSPNAVDPKKNPTGMITRKELEVRSGPVQNAKGLGKDFQGVQEKVEAAKTLEDQNYLNKLDTFEKLIAQKMGTGGLFQSLRTKLASRHVVSEKEPELAKLREREMTIEKWIEQAKKKNAPIDSASMEGLRNAIDEYEKLAQAFLSRKEDALYAPKTPEEAEARKEMIKKVEAIMGTRVETIQKNKKYSINNKVSWAIMFVALLSAGDTQLNKYLEAETAKKTNQQTEQVVAQPQAPDAKKSITGALQEKNPRAAELVKDLQMYPAPDVMRKRAPHYFSESQDPVRMTIALNMFGHVIYDEEHKHGNKYNLSDKARGEFTELYKDLIAILAETTQTKPTDKTFESMISDVKKLLS